MAPHLAKPADPVGSAEDEALLRGLVAGDEGAFAELYLRHADAVARIAHRLVGDGDLDDVVQETFLHAASRAGDLRDPRRLRAWLVTIAVRRAKRVLRRDRWRRRALAVWRWVAPEAGDRRAQAAVEDLRSVLGTISPADRAAWTLNRVEGASLEETAAACGVSLATVKRRIARAEALLQEHLHDT